MSGRAKKKAKTNANVKAKAYAKAKRKSAKRKPKIAKIKRVKKPISPENKPKKAPKAKKPSEKRENAAVKTVVKMGPPPMAVVSVRHIDSMRERSAKGFSFGELSSAGILLDMARREDLSVDSRRRSIVDQNVEALKGWVKDSQKGSAPESAAEVSAKAAQ